MTQPGFGFSEVDLEDRVQQMIEAGKADGIPEETIRAAAAAISATPPIDALGVEVFDLPLGNVQFRVAREYDADEAQATGIPDASRFVVYTPLGRFEFTASRSQVVAALTAEVPYVAPAPTPEQS